MVVECGTAADLEVFQFGGLARRAFYEAWLVGHDTILLDTHDPFQNTKTPLDRKGAAFIKCGVLPLNETPIGRGRRIRTDVSSLFAMSL